LELLQISLIIIWVIFLKFVKKRGILLAAVVGLLICAGIWKFQQNTSTLLIGHPAPEGYPVLGVDVSSYQGKIDWNVMKKQNLQFAFIKATEGSRFTDPYFYSNYKNAVKAGLRVGAYHFFSFDSSGAMQAEHFLSVVQETNQANMLPPVIDIELYDTYEKNPLNKEWVIPQLQTFIVRVSEEYNMAPILYTNLRTYNLYLKNDFPDCAIWISNFSSPPYLPNPSLPDNRDWTFWQYTDKGRLQGYKGQERYIDINVFNGTELEFENYGKRI